MDPKQPKQHELHTEEMADRQFEAEDYNRQDELSQGLAETHEQMSDVYSEGTVEDTNR
ncbi:YozQ family protein [Bacillus sp. CGMCC 1.16541]|uniref:YozQ family protein n=1 Tax=Bacillus sp. CGMCC 1.16541 TaxID=2185143 RepID=UPI000D735F96|nr:YozQ family protein [Bacillus sp. CGMCC 1.16541]